jgi:D-hydroxyproline dehydrogenase subunit gamma
MFRRLRESNCMLTIFVDEVPVRAAPGETVATALLSAGLLAFRETAVSGNPRGPYCCMGVCFDCLVTVDGEGNVQSCLTGVREGMRVTSGSPRRDLRLKMP